jgi:YYY domain-containing protein
LGKKVTSPLNVDFFRKPTFWLLFTIILLGGCFRFYKPNWDYQHSFHPDERNILGQTAGIQPSNGYRVQFFAYGQLPVYLYRATGELLSTPAAFLNFFRGNEGVAQYAYWFVLLLVLALGCASFFRGKAPLPIFTLSSFVFANFALWSLFPLYSNSGFSWLNALYWLLLLGFLFFLYRLFIDEKNEVMEMAVSNLLFIGFLVYKFFPVFFLWIKALEDRPVKMVCFVLIAVVSFGASFLAAKLMEVEWTEIPMYSAAGTTFLLGILPLFFPAAFAQVFGVLAFTLLVTGALFWWSMVSRWARAVTVLLAFWVCLASLNHAGRQYTGYGECMIIGRLWAAAFSTATIGAIYHFVKRAYQNVGMALLAAACFAFAVVSIEQTHYCITESFITFMFVVIAICSYEIIREGSWKNYLLAGGAFGLAMAAKTSSLYYLFILVTAHLVSLSQKSAKEWEKEDKKLGDNEVLFSILAGLLLVLTVIAFGFVGYKFNGVFLDLFWMDQAFGKGLWIVLFVVLIGLGVVFAAWGALEFKILRAQIPQWLKLTGAGGLAFLLFCLLSPWSLLDIQGFMNSQNYEWHVVSIADACYVLQFKDTPRYLYHLLNLMSVELWWPLGVAAVSGMVWVLARFVFGLARPVGKQYLLPLPFTRNRGFAFSLPDLLILCWFIPYFGFIGSWNTKFIRYMVPLIPAFCIFAARLLTDFFRWAKKFSFDRFLKPALVTLVVGPSLFYSFAYMHVYWAPNPWIDASVWIFKHIPPGSMILTEAWDDGLPTSVDPTQDPRMDKFMGPGSYRQEGITVYELHGFPTDDSPIKKNYYANILQKGDYISIASKKLWYTLTEETPEFRPHGFNAYPVTSRYYRCLWSGLLGYKMVGEFHNFPSFLGWEHPDDMAEESFSVYDHPRVYIFKKVETVPPERILKLLETDDYVKGINRDLMRTITPDNVDSFIAQRHQYLESHGLLQQLEEAAPAPVAQAQAMAPVPTSVPEKHGKRREPTPIPFAAAPLIPTPEIQVTAPPTVPKLPDSKTLQVLQSYAGHPAVENDALNATPAPEESGLYQFRAWFSWIFALIFLGWLALPVTLKLLSGMPGGAYSLSKALGFFVFAWVVWFSTSLVKWFHFTTGFCWIWFLLLTVLSAFTYWRNQKALKALYSKWGKSWMIQEGVFVFVFFVFTLVKMYIPHIHDPVGEGYNGGGEAGMDFGFLSSVVRGEKFPPQNMWMAGLPISYSFYYGHLMMGILTKFLGLVPAVTYNLALITLFALIFSCAFGLAFALSGRMVSGWIAGFLCAAAGNPAGARQYMEAIHQCFSAGNLGPLFAHVYDYWGPTRVIPSSINEFPYFSVLYGDLHAHTLAMPFALFLIALVGSYYLSPAWKPFDWSKDWAKLLAAGFLLGGLAFLNTWEVPTWLVLIGLALLVRNMGAMKGKIIEKGLGTLLGAVILGLLLLGWVANSLRGADPQVLGGKTIFLALALLMPLSGGALFLLARKSTPVFSWHLATVAITLGGIVLIMVALWFPYLVFAFSPQQHEVLWVMPSLRTTLADFFGIYGLFVTVLVPSFLAGYSKELVGWMGGKEKKGKWDWEELLDKLAGWLEGLIDPKGPVRGMVSLGVATMFLIWGASWVHWTNPPEKTFWSLLIATPTAVLLALALFFRKAIGLWIAFAGAGIFWICALGFLGAHLIHLTQDMPFTLGMGLFSVLWLLAFFFLGVAVKTLRERTLSFSYLMVSLFFFILATLEIFVMREYLGGDYMRNNSLFKFGINAWELASVAVGFFLPKIFDFFILAFKSVKKETALARLALSAAAALLLFILLRVLLDSFLPSFNVTFVSIFDLLVIGALVGLGWIGNWVRDFILKVAALGVAALLILFSFCPLLPAGSYGTVLYLVERWTGDFDTQILFPVLLSFFTVGILHFLWEGRKDLGRVLAFLSWRALLVVFGLMVLVYPYSATVRKCHGFFDSMRRQWTGAAENLTLNGLAYISRVNPYDAAAIRFLNEHIPDQPCLVEFVGEGYNSWGSRFSIFTGIPALMGWDGHVHEWVTGNPTLSEDVDRRRQANEQIFNTTDPQLAKKTLDAYGVRLVMVGTVERNGVPGRKGGYPPEGLAKFSSFLPLIYRNPQVEIYYNPPSN